MNTLIQEIYALIKAATEQRGLDDRLCYTRVSALPPDGSALVVEASDAGVVTAVEHALDDAARARIRFLALPGPQAGLPRGVIAASSVVDVRREPTHTSELRTQIIYGDAVTPLKLDGDWMLVRLDDAYVGWIRTWHLTDQSPDAQVRFREKARHRVALNHAEVLSAPEPDAIPVTDLVVGTRVAVVGVGKRGWRRVALPDGKEGFMASRAIERVPANRRISPEGLASAGLRFMGIPYLWGGTTPKGFDCSGLIQRIFRLQGRLIPRDSDMQCRHGRRRDVAKTSDLDPGDLLFFGKDDAHITHVGMMLPDGLLLHAYGRVRVGSLDPVHRLYEPGLHSIWRRSTAPLDTDSDA